MKSRNIVFRNLSHNQLLLLADILNVSEKTQKICRIIYKKLGFLYEPPTDVTMFIKPIDIFIFNIKSKYQFDGKDYDLILSPEIFIHFYHILYSLNKTIQNKAKDLQTYVNTILVHQGS